MRTEKWLRRSQRCSRSPASVTSEICSVHRNSPSTLPLVTGQMWVDDNSSTEVFSPCCVTSFTILFLNIGTEKWLIQKRSEVSYFSFPLCVRGINRVAVVSGLSHCRTVAEMVDILLFVPLCRMPTPIDRLEFLKTGYSLSTLKESSSRRRPK